MPTRAGELQASIHVGVLTQAGRKDRDADETDMHVILTLAVFDRLFWLLDFAVPVKRLFCFAI